MKKLLANYGLGQDTMMVYCDNQSAINNSKNPMHHSRNTHIDIWYHFIRDLDESKTVELEFVPIERQLVDLFTNPFDGLRFEILGQLLVFVTTLRGHNACLGWFYMFFFIS